MSFWKRPVLAAKIAVHEPTYWIKSNAVGESSNKNEHLANKKTPAVTIVAAWIKAETGVGPSIASGNQVCKPNCADLPIAPKKSAIQIISKTGKLHPNSLNTKSAIKGTVENTTSYSKLPHKYKRPNKAHKIKKSPTRFTNIAFIAALLAWILVNQKLINKKEDKPTPSQPTNICKKLLLETKISIKKVNKERYDINLGKWGSSAIYSVE